MGEGLTAYFTFHIQFLVMRYIPMFSKTRDYEKAVNERLSWPPVHLSPKQMSRFRGSRESFPGSLCLDKLIRLAIVIVVLMYSKSNTPRTVLCLEFFEIDFDSRILSI